MTRRIIAVVLATLTGGAFVFFGETLGHYLFPAKSPLPVNPEEWSTYIETEVPFLSKLLVIISYALAAFVAGIVSTLLSGRTTMKPMFGSVAILNGLAFFNMLYIPHPGWIWVGTLIAFFPFGMIAYFLIRKKQVDD